jgi:ABC-2 type transport system permease protein
MNSRKILAIARKDVSNYFASPIGYIVMAVFFLVAGFFFNLIIQQTRMASMNYIFQNISFLMLFLSPLITMRLWSEEEKNGTAELLKTSPLSFWEIVLGKYLAVCAFFGVMLSSTLAYLIILLMAGNPDLGPISANYLGCILAVMTFFAVGLLASTMSENQIISAVIAYGMLLMLWVIGFAGSNMTGALGEAVKYIGVFNHMEDFYKGVIDLTHLFYFASMIFLGLFFSVKVLESKRN